MTRPPNILWIVTDQHIHATRPPHLPRFPLQSKLADLGVEFTRAYSVLPVCSPARASMLTGVYPHVHGLTENDGRFGGRSGLDPADWMVHRSLQKSGYRCAWFGKWHVDNHRSAIDYGFEGFSLPGYGYPYATDEYSEYCRRKKLTPPVVEVELPGESGVPKGTRIDLSEQTSWFDYESGVALLDAPVETHEAFFLVDLAKKWIEENDSAPYFLRLDTWGPHPPYITAYPLTDQLKIQNIALPSNFFFGLRGRPQHHLEYRNTWQRTLGQSESQWCLMFQRALEHNLLIETALATLVDCIDLTNTVVIFNSDHGDAVASNGGVANKGGLMVEATMRIPFYVAGANIPRGQKRDHIVSNLDLAPTVASLGNIASEVPMSGSDVLPIVGNPDTKWREGFVAQHYGLHQNLVQRAWYEDQWKFIVQRDGFEELYDLSSDPGETQNLALETIHDETIRKIRRKLQNELLRFNDNAIRLEAH